MDFTQKKTCVCIIGATCVGKTKTAFELAKKYKTEILSFDSRQCYKELNIGVAKPEIELLQLIKHNFINTHSISQNINVNDFFNYSKQFLEKYFINNNYIVLVGGTGLYLDALINGINEFPNIPLKIKQEIQTNIDNYGITYLQNQLQKKDPIFYKQTDINNKYRLQRALEIFNTTNKSILTFYNNPKKKLNYNFKIIGLQQDKQLLYTKINQRVDLMIKNNLVEEAKNLYIHKDKLALKTIGYSEIFDYIENKHSLNEAIEKIKQHTRNYAKRQTTWFKKYSNIVWINTSDTKKINNIIENH